MTDHAAVSMRDKGSGPVLVLGATGLQGGCVARALLARGCRVRALVRAPQAAGAMTLQQAGAELVVGSFMDPESLLAACQGAVSVFSMQNAPFADPDSERHEASNIVAAAQAAGVQQVVHTSVSGAGGFYRTMKGFASGRWSNTYWESKAFAEDVVRGAGFGHVTILRPAFMMENFLRPKADFMFPDLARNEIVTALWPRTRMALVSAIDVGNAAAAAVLDPARFNGAEIELAGDACTMDEVAAILSGAAGRTMTAVSVTPEEAVARGQHRGWVNTQEWNNEVGYPATPADARKFVLQPMDFVTWAKAHAISIARR